MRWGVFIQLALLALSLPAGGLSTAWAAGAPVYGTDFATVLQIGEDVRRMLPLQHHQSIASPPVRLETNSMPRIAAREVVGDVAGLPRRVVLVTSGFIDLVNLMSHARAINNLEPGFFDRFVASLAQESGGKPLGASVQFSSPRYWTDDVLNEQLSNFNQMVGMMVALELAHHQLGHYRKYADRLTDASGNGVPLGDVLTPAEWEQALVAAVETSLNAGFGVDGVIALYAGIERMPRRPAWTASYLPAHAEVSRLRKSLEKAERKYFGGFRK